MSAWEFFKALVLIVLFCALALGLAGIVYFTVGVVGLAVLLGLTWLPLIIVAAWHVSRWE